MSNKLLGAAIVLFVVLIYKHIELLKRISDLTEKPVQGQSVQVDCGQQVTSTGNYAKPTSRLIQMYQRQVSSRKEFLNQVPKSSHSDFARIYNNMAPEVFCAELVKVGTTDDGGKWMCGPFDLPKDCTIFSLGLSNSVSFEEDIQNITKQACKIFSFDTAEQKPEVQKRLREIRAEPMAARISKRTNAQKLEYTLDDLMKKFMVDKIEILKIDIEKSEFDVMEDFLTQHQVSQIMIEVHGNPWQTVEFLRMLSKKGYLVFNYEINGAYHQLCEYALIHESVLDRYGATKLAKYLSD